MQNLNALTQATETLNREGAPTHRRELKEQVVQVLATGTLGNTFYARGKDLAQEALEVLTRARSECPEFLARALVWAREESFMKTLPIVGLVVLSTGHGRTKDLFERTFPRVIRTPDDLRAFVVACRKGGIPGRKGLGGMARDAVRLWLQGLSEYHAVKYGSAASREVTLRDVLRMSHPRPGTPVLAERFAWLVKGSDGLGDDPALNPQIRALEAMKKVETESAQIALIREGRLPYEVVVPSLKATSPAIWAELLRQAPYMNLLRNLVTFTRHGVFQDEANVRYATERLADPRAIERSKVLPFRFFDAWRRYTASEHDSRIADSLRTALDISVGNMPSFGSRTVAIGADVSGSMSWGSISDKGVTRYIDIAGIFTGALLKRVEDRAIPMPFDTRVHTDHGLSGRDDVLTTTEKLVWFGGGGTAVGSPVEYLLKRKLAVDVFIGITDNEDWAYGNGYHSCSGSFIDLWRRYRNQVAPNAKAYLVTIAPYRDAVAPSGEKGIRFIYGWSDAVLRFITQDLSAGSGQIESIERMELER